MVCVMYAYMYMIADIQQRVYGVWYIVHGSFQKSGALMGTPNNGALIVRTPTKGYRHSHIQI